MNDKFQKNFLQNLLKIGSIPEILFYNFIGTEVYTVYDQFEYNLENWALYIILIFTSKLFHSFITDASVLLYYEAIFFQPNSQI